MAEMAARRTPAVANAEWLTALPCATRLAFHGDAAARAAAQPLWGPPFPEEACRAAVQAERATLWLGPDEYLLLDLGGEAASSGGSPSAAPQSGAGAESASGGAGVSSVIFEPLERALANLPHALVDISHRQFALEVHGPHAATLLNGACPLDLDAAEFPVGMCTRTVLAKANIVLWRTRDDAFHVEVWRSFAGYVTGLLQEIASEFYPGPCR